jgi:hypothetical protein
LIFVHLYDLRPVGGNIGESEVSAQVSQVEYILLKARTSESNGTLEELGADPGIGADCPGDFVDIRSGSFTEG